MYSLRAVSWMKDRLNHNPRMVTNSLNSKWGLRLGTLALWAAAGASVVYWGLRLSGGGPSTVAPAVPVAALAPDAQALARLLGAVPAAGVAPAVVTASADSRFALIGVLSGRTSGGGAALIAIDGQPAKPYRVGAVVEPGLVLLSLGPRQAALGPTPGAPAALTLDMPLKK